ncbi:MAG: hypothetical protein OEY89_06475 [Gammaproteobacteria bacterium]|nr:hypothetical protein [Gammaproteobacteria bacterium]
MKMIFRIAIPLFLICTNAFGAVVNYDESIDGDVSNAYWQSGVVDFTFDIGTNIFIGHIEGGNETSVYDFDTFSVLVPNGLVLTGINAFFYPDNTTRFGSTGWNVHDEQPIPGGYYGNISVVTYETGLDREYVTSIDLDLPLGEGIYQFHNAGVGYNNAQVGDHITYSLDYRLEFEVQSVPLPGSLILFLSAMIPLLMGNRLTSSSSRRKNHAA